MINQTHQWCTAIKSSKQAAQFLQPKAVVLRLFTAEPAEPAFRRRLSEVPQAQILCREGVNISVILFNWIHHFLSHCAYTTRRRGQFNSYLPSALTVSGLRPAAWQHSVVRQASNGPISPLVTFSGLQIYRQWML